MNIPTTAELKELGGIRRKIDALNARAAKILGSSDNSNGSNGETPKKSGISEATRRKQSRKKKAWWRQHRAEMAKKK